MRSTFHDRTQVAGLALLGGALAFVVLEQLAEGAYPGFDAATQPLSQLGNSDAPTRWLWDIGLLGLATSWLLATLAMSRAGASRSLMVLNLVPAAGLVVAVAVPLDVDLGAHEIAAFGAFVVGIVAMLVNAARLRGPWRFTTMAGAGLAAIALSPASNLLIDVVGWGTLERLVVLPLIGSLVTFGLALLFDGWAEAAPPRSRRQLLLPATALVLALTGVGSGLTAGGPSVVAAELGHHAPAKAASLLR
ncbi:MAG TPA: DUF998 domain-containing protein [Candidatus Binatus sp.]|nr:DUF998 domain-containing protein [Candidatus Binatus sp.]